MNVGQLLVALLLGGQALWALIQGATVFTPACADFSTRVNDQFNSALLFAALLACAGFWSKRHG